MVAERFDPPVVTAHPLVTIAPVLFSVLGWILEILNP